MLFPESLESICKSVCAFLCETYPLNFECHQVIVIFFYFRRWSATMAPLTNLSGMLSKFNLLLRLTTYEVNTSEPSHFPRDEEGGGVHNFNTNINSRSSSDSGSNSNSSPQEFKPPCCFISDNDPRASYSGIWTLNGTQFSTQHISTDPKSGVSLTFTGNAMSLISEIIADLNRSN